MGSRLSIIFIAVLALLPWSWTAAGVSPIPDAIAVDGERLFVEYCAVCHDGVAPRGPHLITFNMMSSGPLLKVMNEGAMQRQAAALSVAQRAAIAEYLSGSEIEPPAAVLMCQVPIPSLRVSDAKQWTGWGGDVQNRRYVNRDADVISREDVVALELKWAFAYPGATRARSQPVVHDGVVYVGSQSGAVYALNLDSGCTHWIYEAGAEVRNGPSIVSGPEMEVPLLVFGDFDARVHAVNALTGEKVWLTDVATHPDATITGSVKVSGDDLYVPISSSEWATAADPAYACCTFRGSVAALDISTGALQWNTFVIPEEPKDTGEVNAHGASRFGPSGAPVWNSPAIDVERGLLYVGTGQSYTSPASDSSDAVIAIRLIDGELIWRQQLLAGDAWNMACFIGGGANCPEEDGPDLDIGAATIVWQGDDSNLLFVGQKSGDVYGLELDKKGRVRWHRKIGHGGFAGGIHWGMATNGSTLFAPIADTDFLGLSKGEVFPGLHALDPLTGETLWYNRAHDSCPEDAKPACDPGMSAAPTATRDLVFAGGFDGLLRAYDSDNGEILWQFNTFDAFVAVNGDKAQGGSIESDGPVLAGGHLLVNSGYQFGSRMAGNALLVFAPTFASTRATAVEELVGE